MLNNLVRLIKVEHVDDLPVLVGRKCRRCRFRPCRDEYFPTHGLWEGGLEFWPGGGGVVDVYYLAEALLSVAVPKPGWPSASDTLTACCGKPIRPLDFSDYRSGLSCLYRLAETDPLGRGRNGDQSGGPAGLRLGQPGAADSHRQHLGQDLRRGGRKRVCFTLGHSKDHRPGPAASQDQSVRARSRRVAPTTTVVSGE